MEPQEIQQALSDLLAEGKRVTFKWDCGGDEAFVYMLVDDQQRPPRDALSDSLELYLINKLDLPSAGEFSLKGEGQLVKKENEFFLQYQSTWLGYEGDNGWEEVNDVAGEYSGEINIFS